LKEQYLSKGIYMTPTPFMQVGYDLEAARHFVPYSVFNVNARREEPEAWICPGIES
jgi:hypothetical protein